MKIKHILKSEEFADILKKGARASGKGLCLYADKECGGKMISVGVILPKRYIPNAVRRNYIKRVIYLYFREKRDTLKDGIRVVVRVKDTVSENRRKALSVWIKETLDILSEKAKILK